MQNSSVFSVFDTPWRTIKWMERENLEKNLRAFKVCNPQINALNILLHGPVGAGKSSFINSINNVFQHRVAYKAVVAPVEEGVTVTKKFQGHKIRSSSSLFFPFIIHDVMGVEEMKHDGIHPEDINNALLGHLPEGYEFNPSRPLSSGDQQFISHPDLVDRTHCLVCVVPATSVSLMSQNVVTKMRTNRALANDRGIPQFIVMTKIDEVCPLVQQNLQNVYRSKKIKDKMQECSAKLGVTMNCIFPVKNYHEETELDNDTDVLLLLALRQILNFANDHVDEV